MSMTLASVDGGSGVKRFYRTCAICGKWVRYADHVMYLAPGKKRRIRVHESCVPVQPTEQSLTSMALAFEAAGIKP